MRGLKNAAAAAGIVCASLAAHADFSGDFALSNWTPETQTFGCGTSSVDYTNAPASVTFLTSNNCADISVWNRITAPKTGVVSFDWDMSAVSGGGGDHWAQYSVDGTNTQIVNLPGASTGSGSVTFNVQAGQQIALQYKGRTNSQFEISNFVFKPVSATAAPVPVVGIPALILSGFGIFGVAGYLSRRRKQL